MIPLVIVSAGVASVQLAPPIARRVPATIDIHGRTLVDPYSWMDDPDTEADFNAMLAYVRYYSIRVQPYPHMLTTSARNDPRVQFQGPVKFTARLGSLKTDDRMLLLRVDLEGGGHMGSAGRADRLRETAFEYAFLLRALNVED